MNENTEKITLAKCGMDCTACRFAEENDCPGCMQGKVFEDEQCEIYDCCTQKGCEHCGMCPDFPCDDLKDISYDTETGDGGSRILRLKELHDTQYNARRTKTGDILIGLSLGVIFGAVAGSIQSAFIPWIIGGAAAGTGIGVILSLSKRKD